MRRSIDIEDQARQVVDEYYKAYCDPLPAEYELPFVRITSAGGSESNQIDTFTVTVEAYAETDAKACEICRNSVGILKASRWHVVENAKSTRYPDPIRPDLCRYRSTVLITAHQEEFELK